ncbi:hypothetical protein PSECIP111854_00329 [Pseudoalteromonas sp. CIP111854]|uniref:Uncharacterized protein n=1 Tax=Pseudoalteromonas holothuriae TaxID=2963714 RepID=A0A9W4QRA8_9GAMM|nr:hypothetical protein [Pseudoalteromonas sp. CIP111854]CAH9049682.1 hypothetical protein PSECIP111854_00329 [Pseudoalteromonas sp. CIP111854]
MENNVTDWYKKQRESAMWDMLFSCVLEVLVVFAVILLITPFFETLNTFWYGFFLILLPMYIFSEAASALGKLRRAVLAHEAELSAVPISTLCDKPIFHQWQCLSVAAGLLTVLPALGCATLYYLSSKSIVVMVVLGILMGIAIFIGSAMLFERYAIRLVAGTLQQARAPKQLDEAKSIDFLITYHFLPWLVFTTLVFGLLMSKYYLGYVADAGEVSLSSVAVYSFISVSFVGFWSCHTVLESIKADMKLQPMVLSGVGKFSYSDLVGMILGAGSIPWLLFFVIGFFVPVLSSGFWLTTIAAVIIIYAVLLGVGGACLLAFSQSQKQVSAEVCSQ